MENIFFFHEYDVLATLKLQYFPRHSGLENIVPLGYLDHPR